MDIEAKPNDEVLLASALDGNQDAWSELVTRYDLQGMRYAYSQISDYDVAAEIVQEHWTELVRAVSHKPPVSFRAFFWRLLKCRIIDWIRKKARTRELATLYAPVNAEDPEQGLVIDQEASSVPDPLDAVVHNEEQDLIHRALLGLPPNYRVTIQARLLEDRSVQETAQILLAQGLIAGDGDLEKQVYNLDSRAPKGLVKRLRELGYERGR